MVEELWLRRTQTRLTVNNPQGIWHALTSLLRHRTIPKELAD